MLDFDWRRLMRWCIFGAVVMTIWVFAPTGRCSYRAFRDEPLDEAYPISDTAGSHKIDSVDGEGFFSRWGTAIKVCYKYTAPLDRTPWKRNVLFGCLGGAVLFYALSEIERRKKKTYT